MPNLEHDPKNPTDLLGRSIAEGDIVAWGTTYGRSPAIAVCRIEKIRFIRKAPPGNWRVVNEECRQDQAEDYQLSLAVLKSTGSVSFPEKYHPNGYIDADGNTKYFEQTSDKPKLKNIKLVKNIVKINLDGDL